MHTPNMLYVYNIQCISYVIHNVTGCVSDQPDVHVNAQTVYVARVFLHMYIATYCTYTTHTNPFIQTSMFRFM